MKQFEAPAPGNFPAAQAKVHFSSARRILVVDADICSLVNSAILPAHIVEKSFDLQEPSLFLRQKSATVHPKWLRKEEHEADVSKFYEECQIYNLGG